MNRNHHHPREPPEPPWTPLNPPESPNYLVFRSYWVPDGEGGFLEGLVESENGGKVVVTIQHEKRTLKNDQIQQVEINLFIKGSISDISAIE